MIFRSNLVAIDLCTAGSAERSGERKEDIKGNRRS